MPPERRSLATERTALGWQRSSLSLALIAALLLLHGVHRGQALAVIAAFVVGAGAAWAGAWGSRLYRRRMAGLYAAAPRPLLGLVAVTIGAAAVAAAEILGGG